MEFRDFYERVAKVIEYEKLLKEEEIHGNLLLRGEPGCGNGSSIYYGDIHLSSFSRKGT